MTRPLDSAKERRSARIFRGLARHLRAFEGGRRAAAAGPVPFQFPHPRTLHARELERLERDQFPMWRPDPVRVRALQSQSASTRQGARP